jgi:signal transduction histidine kinase
VLLSKTLRSSTLKLALIYVGAFSAAIFAVLGYVYWETAAYLERQSDAAVAVERSMLLDAYNAGSRDRLVAQIDQRVADKHFAGWSYLLVDPSFAYIAGNLPSWPARFRGAESLGEGSPVDWKPEARELRATYWTLPGGDHLLLARQVDDLHGVIATIGTGIAAAAGLFLLLAAAAGISTARRSVTRIETINATSREIMRTGPGKRIPLRGTGDEWDELADNLNSMLDRIEELVASNRQVSDNVAHDLRTPLTRMRGRLERAYHGRLDPSQYQALVGDTIAELDEILRTFSSLLRISQIEIEERRAGFRRIDLTELAREVVELFDATAEEKGVRLGIAGEQPVWIEGDRDMLFDAISNLVDNAIKHGGKGGISVAVAATGNGGVLRVADRGPGIPVEERKHVFKRFYRLERSRNAAGNGLGLSLVAAVAHLHDARIEMADNCPGLAIVLHFSGSEQPARPVAPHTEIASSLRSSQ